MSLLKNLADSLRFLDCNFSALDNKIEERFLHYLFLIEKWNRVYNLTAIKKPNDMIYHHIMDSLSVLPYLNGPCIADIGTGAGLPGIPIAIARPDWYVTLIESNQKKTTFLQQVKIELNLHNIVILNKRVENITAKQEYDTVISRAFSDLKNFISLAGHLCHNKSGTSRLVAMKANCLDDELNNIPYTYLIEKKINIDVPGLNAPRQLIILKNNSSFF